MSVSMDNVSKHVIHQAAYMKQLQKIYQVKLLKYVSFINSTVFTKSLVQQWPHGRLLCHPTCQLNFMLRA